MYNSSGSYLPMTWPLERTAPGAHKDKKTQKGITNIEKEGKNDNNLLMIWFSTLKTPNRSAGVAVSNAGKKVQ